MVGSKHCTWSQLTKFNYFYLNLPHDDQFKIMCFKSISAFIILYKWRLLNENIQWMELFVFSNKKARKIPFRFYEI